MYLRKITDKNNYSKFEIENKINNENNSRSISKKPKNKKNDYKINSFFRYNIINLSAALSDDNLSYRQLKNIVLRATFSLTFWNGRSIQSQGYEGNATIDFLSELVEKMVIKNWNYTEQERMDGKIISKRISHFYRKSNKKLLKSSCFFRTYLRFDLTNSTKTPFWYWFFLGRRQIFNYYTAEQWKVTFPHDPLPPEPCEHGIELKNHFIKIPDLYHPRQKVNFL